MSRRWKRPARSKILEGDDWEWEYEEYEGLIVGSKPLDDGTGSGE